jgi:hypothetical protein
VASLLVRFRDISLLNTVADFDVLPHRS